jgi:hypothetical protein
VQVEVLPVFIEPFESSALRSVYFVALESVTVSRTWKWVPLAAFKYDPLKTTVFFPAIVDDSLAISPPGSAEETHHVRDGASYERNEYWSESLPLKCRTIELVVSLRVAVTWLAGAVLPLAIVFVQLHVPMVQS